MTDTMTASSKLIAWCDESNNITINDTLNSSEFRFQGVRIHTESPSWMHVREIPNTNKLISLQHIKKDRARFHLLEVSETKSDQIRTVYCSEEILGGVSDGDLSYNAKRGLIALGAVRNEIAYHLFQVEGFELLRKARWNSSHESFIESMDIDPGGKRISLIDSNGELLLSNVDSNEPLFTISLGGHGDWNRVRWVPLLDAPILFATYQGNKLNLIDSECKKLLYKEPLTLDEHYTYWIDCHKNGNLLLTTGSDGAFKIYDCRKNKIVRNRFVHDSIILTARWDPEGQKIASASYDDCIKVTDVRNEKVLFETKNLEAKQPQSVCFL